MATVLLLALIVGVFSQSCFPLAINWGKVLMISKMTTTLQVVSNPILNPKTSPVSKNAWASLKALNADYIRYVPWYVYPKVGVAELEPPNATGTSWNFEHIKPQWEQFIAHTSKRTIPNFSTQPTWMYNTTNWSYPANPNAVCDYYPRGNALPTTTKLLAEYYTRLLLWLTKGGFNDERGKYVGGGYHYNLTHWEIFNEPEGCHGLDVVEYTKQYDAIVKSVRQAIDPEQNINFVGLALIGRHVDWITYWLDDSNHDPAALPLTHFSYHFYAGCSKRTDPNSYQEFFDQADKMFDEAAKINAVRHSLNPDVKIDIDECGVILPGENNGGDQSFPRIYWNAANAFYTYVFANLSTQGYDILGCSQLAGSPPIPEWDIPDSQYPSVSMTNWTTGNGTARLWGLKLLIDHFQPGDMIVQTFVLPTGTPNSIAPHVHAVLTAKTRKRKLLFINKSNTPVCIGFTATVTGTLSTVDLDTEDGPARVEAFSHDSVNLAEFAVSVLELSN